MTTTKVDDRKRVVVPQAKPGQVYAIHDGPNGIVTLTPVKPVEPAPTKCKLIKNADGFTVIQTDRPIDMLALEEALKDFPFMKHLLDVNVLLAGIIQTHPHYAKAQAWLKDKQIVLCPLSELGFIRISTNKKVSGLGLEMNKAREALERFISERKANRIDDDLPALESHARISDQVTDHYLADLAAKHGLKLATLDGRLRHPSAELV